MATIVLIPNDHLLAWVYHAPGQSPVHAVSLVRRGGWPFPPEWRCVLDEQFIVPEGLRLLALAHSDLVVVCTSVPLQERVPGRFLPLSPGQAQVLTMIAQGFTTGQIARSMHVRRRWVKYRVAEVKRRLGAVTRAQAVARRGQV